MHNVYVWLFEGAWFATHAWHVGASGDKKGLSSL